MESLSMSTEIAQSNPDVARQGDVVMTLATAIGIGQEFQRKGLLGEAEAVYRAILSKKPDQPEALHFLGVVLHQIGRSEEAIETIIAALEADPTYVAALSNLGNILHDTERFDEAESVYRRAMELNPQFADAYLNLAVLYFNRERYEEAVAMSQCAFEFGKDQPKMQLLVGTSLAEKGQNAAAAEEYLRAMERKLFHAGVHENMGFSLLRLGRIDEAISVYRRWIKLDPDNPRPLHHLAACTGVDVPRRASNAYLRDVFDRFAASFNDRLKALEYSAPTLVIESLKAELGNLNSRYRVLDAGCGTGLCGAGIRPFAQHLTGVDISSKMLEKASELRLYDELVESELTEFLERSPAAFDVVVSADTLIYFGDLSHVANAAWHALRPAGRFVFTLENIDPAAAPEGFRLENHGRYAHTSDYVRQVMEQAGFGIGEITAVFLRMEGRIRVMGWLVVGRVNSCKGLHFVMD